MMHARELLQARRLVAAAAVVCAVWAGSTRAQSIIDEWSTVKTPPAPPLKNVTLDRKTTALLLLDFNEQTCNQERRPRCIASIPKVRTLLAAARDAGVPVAFSVGGGGKAADINKDLTPTKDEPVVSSGLDKFVGTELESFLKQHGVKTVVVAGVAAHGAVLYTVTTAAERGLHVVVPVDGISADALYPEQYTTWHLVNAPRIGTSVTLTKIDDVKF
jgi:nicotinamidase-related amidase